jgi:hypothetical protein
VKCILQGECGILANVDYDARSGSGVAFLGLYQVFLPMDAKVERVGQGGAYSQLSQPVLALSLIFSLFRSQSPRQGI